LGRKTTWRKTQYGHLWRISTGLLLFPSCASGYGRGRPRPSALSGEVLGSSFTLWPRRSRLEPDATALVDGEPSARHCFSFPEDSQDGHIIPSGRAEMPGEPGQDCSLVALANA
jgi:hypothetical protein